MRGIPSGFGFGCVALVLVYLSTALCQALWLMTVIILENVYILGANRHDLQQASIGDVTNLLHVGESDTEREGEKERERECVCV